MAVDLTAQSVPSSGQATLTNPNVAYEIKLPRAADLVVLEFVTNDGLVAYSGTDGSALTGGHDQIADQSAEWSVQKKFASKHPILPTPKLYVQTATGGTVLRWSLARIGGGMV